MREGAPPGRPSVETADLLEVDPDFAAGLGEHAREARAALKVVLVTIPPGPCDVEGLIAGRRASGAVVVEGLISRRTLIGAHAAVELIWPGDVIAPLPNLSVAQPFLVPEISWTAELTTRLALLPPSTFRLAVRWPELASTLRERMEVRHARLATVHAIAQVPRAEERLRLLLWLLAGRFGRVTAQGGRAGAARRAGRGGAPRARPPARRPLRRPSRTPVRRGRARAGQDPAPPPARRMPLPARRLPLYSAHPPA